MKKADAITLAGSAAELARILGIRQQSMTDWGEYIPPLRAYQLRDLKPEWFKRRAAPPKQQNGKGKARATARG